MDATLLGSGEAVGVPAPLCDCEYCEGSAPRRRACLLVETDEATVVLDAGPDVASQLHATDTTDVNAFFVTHHHYDHVGGLPDLAHAAMGFDAHVGVADGFLDPDPFDDAEKPRDPAFAVYLSETALGHAAAATPHLLDPLDLRTVAHGESVTVGDIRVEAFPVDHARPAFDTLGFAVHNDDAVLVYAPDLRRFLPERDGGRAYEDADLLVAEGAALFRAYGHGPEADLREALAAADADRTVLVNVNEHLQRATTDELAAVAADAGYELGRDLRTYRL